MKININTIKIKIKLIEPPKKDENLLANAFLTFKGDSGDYFAISGFTVWKSNYGGLNVTVPQKPGFKYCLFNPSFWRELKKEIIKAYQYTEIPVIEEKEGGSYYSRTTPEYDHSFTSVQT